MDKETLSKYGWVVIVIIIIVILLGFAAPLGNFVADSAMATLESLNRNTPSIIKGPIKEIITQVTPEEIESNPLVYGIGATKQEYVIATFNEDYSEVVITKNGKDSDGKMVDWSNPTVPFEQPMFTHRKTLTKMTVEPGVVNMGQYCAINTPYLTKLSLPEGLESIGINSFWGSGITSLELPSTVKTLGKQSFAECENLTSLKLNDGLEVIGHSAFTLCFNIKHELIIPDTVKFIGNFAFGSDSTTMGFTSIHLGNSVEFIGRGAFQICHKATNDIQLPDSLKVIGDFAFNHLMNVTTTTLKIPASVIQIGGTTSKMNITPENFLSIDYLDVGTHTFYDFARSTLVAYDVDENNQHYKDVDGVLYSKDGTRLLSYPSNKPGREYEILEGVNRIDELAFNNVYVGAEENYLKVVTIPNSLIIKQYPERSPNILNIGNTIANALYSHSGVEEIRIKNDNTNYMVEDGCLYSADGKTCLYIPTYKRVVNIREGCVTIDGAYMPAPQAIRDGEDPNITINIPSSVTSIIEYVVESMPEENTLAYYNRLIDSRGFNGTINVDPANTVYTTDTNGYLIKK